MRPVDRVTYLYRKWLKEWTRFGGDPEAPEATYVKERIAKAEEGAADDDARRDYNERRHG